MKKGPKLQSIKAQKKPWDDRFWLGKLENNSTSSQSKTQLDLMKSRTSRVLLEVTQRKNFRQVSAFKHLDYLQRELERHWSEKSVPEYFQRIYSEFLFGSEQRMRTEIEHISTGKSVLLELMKSIQDREKSIQSLTEFNTYLENVPDWAQIYRVNKECRRLLKAHKILTLNAIEIIQQWIAQFNKKCIWDGQNYLVKILNDLDFLAKSPMAQGFKSTHEEKNLFLIDERQPEIAQALNNRVSNAVNYMQIQSIHELREAYTLEILKNPPSNYKDLTIAELIRRDYEEATYSTIIDSFINQLAHDTDQDYTELIYEYLFSSSIKEIVTSITNKILIYELYEELLACLDEGISDVTIEQEKDIETKLEMLHTHIIAENIYRSLVELVLDETDTDFISEKTLMKTLLRRKTTVKDTEEELSLIDKESQLLKNKISKSIFKDLLNEFIDRKWFDDLVVFIYNIEFTKQMSITAEDYAFEMFTPHVHSPMAYSIVEDLSAPNTPYLDFCTNPNEEEIEFVPADLPHDHLLQAMIDYYTMLSSELKSALMSLQALEIACLAGNDTSWYWAKQQDSIVGALIYCADPFSVNDRKLIILHVSCLFYINYLDFLKEACTFIWRNDTCQEIRVSLHCPIEGETNRAIKDKFHKVDFKWKAQRKVQKCKLTILGASRPEFIHPVSTLTSPIKVGILTVLHLGTQEALEETELTEKTMNSYSSSSGSRLNIANALLGFYNNVLSVGKFQYEDPCKHQVEELIAEIIGLDFPYIESNISSHSYKLADYISKKGFSLDLCSEYLKSVSMLNLNFNWVGCTSIQSSLYEISYKCLKFHSNLIKARRSETYEVFIVPTSQESIYGFFIRGDDFATNDLCGLTEEILLICQEEVDCSLFAVPAFRINRYGEVPWVKGFLIHNPDSQNTAVVKGQEGLSVDIDNAVLRQGSFSEKMNRKVLFDEDFVFGLVAVKPQEIPLFAVLVQRKDWVVAY